MNSTTTGDANTDTTLMFLGWGLFLFSEVLPFIKKSKGNGFLHTLLCLLTGSECVIKNVKEAVEKNLDTEHDDSTKNADIENKL